MIEINKGNLEESYDRELKALKKLRGEPWVVNIEDYQRNAQLFITKTGKTVDKFIFILGLIEGKPL